MNKIPFIGPFPRNSGIIAADGTITVDPPLPEAYPEAYYLLPKNAVKDGSERGWYYVRFSTTSKGKVFDKRFP